MLRKIIFCLLVTLIPGLASSDEVKFYTIELVVFENLDAQARQSEIWPTDTKLTLPTPLVELGSNAEQKYGFRTQPKSSYRFAQEIKSLQDTNQYRILLHTAWRQPGLEVQSALPVHLTAEIKPISPPDTTTLNSSTTLETQTNTVNGTVKIILGRFLHAEIDLLYQSHSPSTEPSVGAVPANTIAIGAPQNSPVYRVKQTRKMRSKEIHYIDSPVLGVLIYITPVDG